MVSKEWVEKGGGGALEAKKSYSVDTVTLYNCDTNITREKIASYD